jgi:hypothetical protein
MPLFHRGHERKQDGASKLRESRLKRFFRGSGVQDEAAIPLQNPEPNSATAKVEQTYPRQPDPQHEDMQGTPVNFQATTSLSVAQSTLSDAADHDNPNAKKSDDGIDAEAHMDQVGCSSGTVHTTRSRRRFRV